MNLDDLVAAIDGLVIEAGDDHESIRLLASCRRGLAALAWERFRVKHEAASQARTAAHARATFVQRHKTHI